HYINYAHVHSTNLHSFPTRRSSDLPRKQRRSDDCEGQHPSACQKGSDEAVADSAARLGVRARCVVRNFSARPKNAGPWFGPKRRSEEHTSELQSQSNLVCRLLLEKK